MAYDAGDQLPVGRLEPGTYVLSGPPLSGKVDVLASLLTAGGESGRLVVATERSVGGLRRGTSRPFVPPDGDVDVVDCTGGDAADAVGRVSTPGDLTGIGIETSPYLSAHGGAVRLGVHSLSTLLMYSDFRPVFRFTHVLSNRVDLVDGLGVFVLHSSTHDDRVVNSLLQVADGRIDLREHDGREEVRVRAPGQRTGWAPRR